MRATRLAFAAAVLLTASACGTAAVTPGPTIKIAALYPLSGPYADNGTVMLEGAKIAVDIINEQGGIKSMNGRKLEIVSADVGASAETAASAATRILAAGGISAVFGSFLSSFSLAIAPLTDRGKVPFVADGYADALTESGYSYLVDISPPSSQLGPLTWSAMSSLATGSGQAIKRIVIVGDNTAFAGALIKALEASIKASGSEVVLTFTFQPPISDANTLASQVAAAKPDALFFVTSSFDDTSRITAAVRSARVSAPITNTSMNGNFKSWQALGEAVKGSTVLLGFWPNSTTKVDPKVEELRKDAYRWGNGSVGYASVLVIREALEKAASIDGEALNKALHSLNVTTGALAGLSADNSFSFDEKGRVKGKFGVLAQWQSKDGTLAPCIVWPTTVAACQGIWGSK